MTNRQYFYNVLRAAGLTHAGALGVVINLDSESPGCEPYRMEGDFSSDLKKSKEYAEKVDSGEISKHIFSRSGGGWGAAQWTWYTRKENLFDAAKNAGKSIGDRGVQADFVVWELKNYFPQLLQFLKVTESVYNATARVCKEYEQPAVNNIDARYAKAQQIEKEVKSQQSQQTPTNPTSKYWPPRMIDQGMSGPDVEVLQAILKARGYAINYVGGKFDSLLTTELKKFQSANNLSPDGVSGPLTWAKVLEVTK